MLNTHLARKVLTQEEQDHLTESGINDLAALIRQSQSIRATMNEHPEDWAFYSCRECALICNKLGVLL